VWSFDGRQAIHTSAVRRAAKSVDPSQKTDPNQGGIDVKRTVISAIAAALLALPSAAGAQTNDWKIATLLPVTGPYANYTIEFRLGMEIARDEINAKGGILGRKMELEILDTQSNPGQVASLIRRACAEAFVVAGPSLSNEARVAFPVANSMSCPALSSSAAASGLTDNARPWTFTYASPASIITPEAINLLVKKLQPKRAVVIVDRADPAASDQADRSAKALGEKGVATQVLTISANDVDFGPVVTRLAGQTPDIVVISTTDKGAVGVLKEMKKTQQKAAILITQSAFTPLVSAAGAEALEGVYRYTEFDPLSSTDPRVKAFIDVFKSRNSDRPPTQIATQSYDLIYLVKHVMETSGIKGTSESKAQDRKLFVETMARLKDWPSISGPMSIAPEGYSVKSVTVLVFRDGKPVRVTAD
jgi:branched-chain amino acid transport system substrate-binding protein